MYVSVSLIRHRVGLLTYRVPPGLQELARPGVRVAVPLSRTRATGYVVAEAEPPPEGQDEARDVLDVLDAEPLLTATQLALARFAARYYLAPLSDALRLLHPAGMDLVERRTLAITEEGRLALERANGVLAVQGLELSAPQRRVLALLARQEIAVAALLKRVPEADHRALLDLQRRGLVEPVRSDYAPRVKVVTEQYASLVPGALEAFDLERLRRTARVQAGLLSLLQEAGEPVPVSALRERYPGLRVPLDRLAERGLVTLQTRERRRDPFAGVTIRPHPAPDLNVDQSHALAVLSAGLREGGFQPFLLHGVTSSGKTEVYLRIIREALDAGRSAIVLVPEISLTPQLAGRFRARFPEGVAVLHSGLGAGQREDEWRRVRAREVRLVVGARSALFAPVRDLGVLVVDEEHDSSFKQEEGLRYHARNLALVRGQREGAVVVLGSATPSLESSHNAENGRLRRLQLPRRATPQPLPAVEVVDLRRYQLDPEGVLTAPLAEALGDTLASGQQAIIFLNRRGFAPFVLCTDCGQPVRCHDCSVTLTLHKRRQILLCHYCGHQRRPPARCPLCDGDRLRPMGLGTERVEESLRARWPEARIGRLDRDTARGKGLQRILDATAAGELDILVGTQMVTKGHDFPGVTLVGVVNADHALHLPDFRSAERTFQLLSQVAGRAGRGGAAGRVLVQTFNPEHHAIESSRSHDYEAFYAAESRLRRELGYPPFGHLVALRMEGPDEQAVVDAANRLAGACHEAARPFRQDRQRAVTVLGPVEAPIARIRGRFRWQILLKSKHRPALHEVSRTAQRFKEQARRTTPASAKDLRILIDVDPQSML
jgi:primosomal protein N' (replication factor Y)